MRLLEALPVKSNTWGKNLTCHKEPMRSRTMTAIWTCGSLPFIYKTVPSKIITLHMSYHIKEVSLCSAGEALWNLIWKEHISPVHQDHFMLCANLIISRAFLQKKKELIEWGWVSSQGWGMLTSLPLVSLSVQGRALYSSPPWVMTVNLE